MIDCCLLFVALLQDPFPKPGADPAGVVLDEEGHRIPGASVALRCDPAKGHGWSRALQQVLQQTPLPSATTDRDGEFVLPLTRDQRLLGLAQEEEAFALVVEKEGFQRWCELLPNGLAGYLGSRVVLNRLEPGDAVTVVVGEPEPGMRVAIKRTIRGWLAHDDPDPGESADVPADGRVTVRLPLVPSPSPAFETDKILLLGLRAELWRGGQLLATKELAPEQPNAWPKSEWSAPPKRPASRPASAAGPGTARTRTVRIRALDAKGNAIAGALVLCDDAAAATGPLRHTDEQGEAVLAGLPLGATTVRVLQEGYLAGDHALAADSEAAAPVEITLTRSVVKLVWTVDGDAKAVPFVRLRTQVGAGKSDSRLRKQVTSDSLGRAWLPWPDDRKLRVYRHMATTPELVGDVPMQRYVIGQEPWVLLRMPPGPLGTSLHIGLGRSPGNRSSSPPPAPGTWAVLMRWRPADDMRAIVPPETGPAVILRTADVDAAELKRGLAILDRSSIVRRIPMRVTTDDGKGPDELLAIPLLPSIRWDPTHPRLPSIPSHALEPGTGGMWSLAARDLGAFDVILLSPLHLPQRVAIPAHPAGHVDVKLERAAPFSVCLVPKELGIGAGRPGAFEELALSNPRVGAIRLRMEYPALTEQQLGQPHTFRASHGMPPGMYQMHVRGSQREVELTFEGPRLGSSTDPLPGSGERVGR